MIFQRFIRLLLISFLFQIPSFASESQLTLKTQGKMNQQIPLSELVKKVQPEKITVSNPIDGKLHTYEGIPTQKLFDHVWGSQWRTGDEILMTCLDGYQPSIPVDRFLHHQSWIATRRIDSANFTATSQKDQKAIQLGPFYLIWENLKDQEMKAEGENGWPYQLIAFDQIQFIEKFPKLAPSPHASRSARAGFVAFRKYCLKCHAINQEGGNVGPELHTPVNVTQYFNQKWLKVWIKDPSLVRKNSKMPPPLYDLKDPKKIDEVVNDLIAYLKSIP